MIEQVVIKNYKSIRDLSLPLNRLNVLIGSNGVGKSNFISFFELTKAIYEQRFGSYTLSKGGIDSLLYRGRKVSPSIHGLLALRYIIFMIPVQVLLCVEIVISMITNAFVTMVLI